VVAGDSDGVRAKVLVVRGLQKEKGRKKEEKKQKGARKGKKGRKESR
jgi:hypothetical protein